MNMIKLHGEDLDKELEIRKAAKEKRIQEKKTFRKKAKELGMKPSEYLAWEHGQNICPHDEFKMVIGGVHPPFILFRECKKCKYVEGIRKIETDDDFKECKQQIEEALKNQGAM